MFKPSTILITGGGTGIGKGLAEAFHERGSKVIVAGRREGVLKALTAAHPGMEHLVVDVADAASVAAAAKAVEARWPGLDCLVNNAGVQHRIDFSGPEAVPAALLRKDIDVNLVGLLQMTSALLPLLLRQGAASVINVSSGLALTPLATNPVYCATKAAVHSFSMSLRHQLKDAGVRVIEVMPPLVIDTELHDAQDGPLPDAAKAFAQTVAQFTEETLGYLDAGEDEMGIGPTRQMQVEVRAMIEPRFQGMNGRF